MTITIRVYFPCCKNVTFSDFGWCNKSYYRMEQSHSSTVFLQRTVEEPRTGVSASPRVWVQSQTSCLTMRCRLFWADSIYTQLAGLSLADSPALVLLPSPEDLRGLCFLCLDHFCASCRRCFHIPTSPLAIGLCFKFLCLRNLVKQLSVSAAVGPPGT